MDLQIKIQRFEPGEDQRPYFQTYQVSAQPTDRILDCLNRIKWEQDGTLGYRMSCGHGVCGSDAMKINGRCGLSCQRLVKEAFLDYRLKELNLTSANSISVGRLIPQSLYYFWARSRMDVDPMFCVPSGNLGNLTAGIIAYLSGMPASGFLAAHNANDFFVRFLDGPSAEFGPSVRTLSNAMDVGAPSNFERLGRLLPEDEMRRIIRGVSISDGDTLESMKRVYEDAGYLADPHTAVGLEAVRRLRASTGISTPVVVLSTAHPAKFPEIVESALGFIPDRPERLARYWAEGTDVAILEPGLDHLVDALL